MTDVRAGILVEPVGDVTAVLGEGPYWVPEDSCLLWVDIMAGLLHVTEIPSGRTVPTEPDAVSAVFPAHGGGLLYAGGHKIVVREPVARSAIGEAPRPAPGQSGEWAEREIAQAPALDGVRFNDAPADPAGRGWAAPVPTGQTAPPGPADRPAPPARLPPAFP